jgi:hypothetical protein
MPIDLNTKNRRFILPFRVLFVIFLITYSLQSISQETKPVIHSANKASLYSAILPGAGQAYNKKYWKIPVIYAGFGTLIYFIHSNNTEYVKFRDAYSFKAASSPDSTLYNDYADKYPLASLLEGRDYYRRNRDLTYILTSVWYVLNVVDAAVDAHLFDYDISDNLSMQWQPEFYSIKGSQRPVFQLSLSFQFK